MAWAYLDQNALSHADDSKFVELIAHFHKSDFRPLISHIHLLEICKSSTPERFFTRISALNPGLLNVPSGATYHPGERTIIEIFDPREVVLEFKTEQFQLQHSLIMAHLPMLKMMGGIGDISTDVLLDSYLRELDATIESALSELDEPMLKLYQEAILEKSRQAKEEITRNFMSINFSSSASEIQDLRRLISTDGGLHQCDPNQIIQRVTEKIRGAAINPFEEFPKDFVKSVGDNQSRFAALCLLLYCLGAVPRSGEIFRGSSERQMKRFFAQILDFYHVGEAAVSSAFVTFDRTAYRLASAVFHHAGVGTKAILLMKQM